MVLCRESGYWSHKSSAIFAEALTRRDAFRAVGRSCAKLSEEHAFAIRRKRLPDFLPKGSEVESGQPLFALL
ncbi:MAG: hypothetical protein Q4G61_09600 [Tissierellia bacterium]|nr:hypothetical protein [Tissierellia bacterium]